ncbi:hypothetical protein [Rhodoferax sp.]|uniref:hypothetical protein n=1 Tax=Rhodoferax sp. TaxID=50421 RepID=UPI002ACECDA3|nr:hypothetical protein [Rhodoferax sp.]MDZ7921602.1 hypothetical protein [Rhodoferax sp.]
MWEWQLSDSEVTEVRHQEKRVTLYFSVVAARGLGDQPGDVATEWGYAQGVILDLHQAQVQHADDFAAGRIAEGRFFQEGEPLRFIPLPAVRMQANLLELRFANGAVLQLTAQAWQCRFGGEPRFRESYAC